MWGKVSIVLIVAVDDNSSWVLIFESELSLGVAYWFSWIKLVIFSLSHLFSPLNILKKSKNGKTTIYSVLRLLGYHIEVFQIRANDFFEKVWICQILASSIVSQISLFSLFFHNIFTVVACELPDNKRLGQAEYLLVTIVLNLNVVRKISAIIKENLSPVFIFWGLFLLNLSLSSNHILVDIMATKKLANPHSLQQLFEFLRVRALIDHRAIFIDLPSWKRILNEVQLCSELLSYHCFFYSKN